MLYRKVPGDGSGAMMTDEEVGKLWKNAMSISDPSETMQDLKALIRKLVKDRAYSYLGKITLEQATRIALGNFGIDPATWKKSN